MSFKSCDNPIAPSMLNKEKEYAHPGSNRFLQRKRLSSYPQNLFRRRDTGVIRRNGSSGCRLGIHQPGLDGSLATGIYGPRNRKEIEADRYARSALLLVRLGKGSHSSQTRVVTMRSAGNKCGITPHDHAHQAATERASLPHASGQSILRAHGWTLYRRTCAPGRHLSRKW